MRRKEVNNMPARQRQSQGSAPSAPRTGVSISFMPRVARAGTEVPDNVAAELAETAAYLQEHDDLAGLAEFRSEAEREVWKSQAIAWCAMHGYRFRQGRASGLSELQMRFYIKPLAD